MTRLIEFSTRWGAAPHMPRRIVRSGQPFQPGQQAVQLVAGVVHGDARAEQPAALGETQHLHRTRRVEVAVPNADAPVSQGRGSGGRGDSIESDRYGRRARAAGAKVRTPDANAGNAARGVMIVL